MNNERIFRTTSTEQLEPIEIRQLTEQFLSLGMHYVRLDDYYRVRNQPIMAMQKPEDIPNNKVANAFAKYISDTLTGYFLGQPVVYGVDADGSQQVLDRLQECFDYNDEQSENYRLGLMASINGVAYELLYLDEDGRARFAAIDPREMFAVYDATISNRLICAIRTYVYRLYDGEEVRHYECYDALQTRHFIRDSQGFRLIEETPNYFGDVPVVVYENNDQWMGDFEPVITLIDAYDKVQSNTLNDMEQFTDAYMKFRNLSGTTAEDLAEMRKKKIILLDDDGEADWLVKSVNDTWVENFKTRLQNDIHKFSGTPDMTDESFGGNVSGVSLRYKLIGMEQIRAAKERCFKVGLQRRIELLCNHFRLRSTDDLEAYTSITMTFNNTLPQNVLELSQIVGNLADLLSEETKLKLLPFIEDPAAEIEKREAEKEERTATNYDRLMGLAPHADAEPDEGVNDDGEPTP